MARAVRLGAQNYADIREGGFFYVDKTWFLREWWEAGDDVTLVCRPRRFGKTLMLDTLRSFFSLGFADRGEELFGGLSVWEDPGMRELQGTVPVVALSFAAVKEPDINQAKAAIKRQIRMAVRPYGHLAESPAMDNDDRAFLSMVSDGMDDLTATEAINQLCSMLHRHYGVKPIVLLDEYDTPMQEAWLQGYWDGMSQFMRSLMNSTFKTNPSLGRGLITGVTRIAQESIFSDLNNLSVAAVTSPRYETAFGFTQEEVDDALGQFGLEGRREALREWYDGFAIGHMSGIYNPWSITSFLQNRELGLYWANTSSNALVSSLVRRSAPQFKDDFAALVSGRTVSKRINESIDFRHLYRNPETAWTLLLATGYLRPVRRLNDEPPFEFELSLTNKEVARSFDLMIANWFEDGSDSYNGFTNALLAGDAEAMEAYLGDLAAACMSSFDSATHPSEAARPERFWHGLALGLLVELRGRYAVESNRESGYGRCDLILAPNDGAGGTDPAIVLEFKVFSGRRGETTLEDTVASALAQIAERGYATSLIERGIARERIRAYGIAFRGKEVLVGQMVDRPNGRLRGGEGDDG